MAIDKEQYAVIAARRVATDAMLWQTPTLSIAAQSFLLAIALNVEAAPHARWLAGALAVFASLATLYLMRKHRHFEFADSELLEACEKATEAWEVVHCKPKDVPWYLPRPAWELWMYLLGAFCVVAVIALILIPFTPPSPKTPPPAPPAISAPQDANSEPATPSQQSSLGWITASLLALFGLIITGFGGYVAWQQYVTARDKLRLDLFDRRWSVYEGVRTFLNAVRLAGITDADLAKFNLETAQGEFLFKDDITKFLEELHSHGREMLLVEAKIKGQSLQQERGEAFAEKERLHDWFREQAQYQRLVNRFQPYLNFQQQLS